MDAPNKQSDEQLWNAERLRNPHAVTDKQKRVQQMFAAIAPRYDLNNRLWSFGTDQRWRKKAVKLSRLKADDVVVDVACGTGDLSQLWFRGLWHLLMKSLKPTDRWGRWPAASQVVGVDYTREMLAIADRKRLPWKGGIEFIEQAEVAEREGITYLQGDAQNLPLPDACCDVVSIAFGIRNVADSAKAYREFRRVLRPGGRVVVLEFSKPTNKLIRLGYDFYFNHILTRMASVVARDKTGAYRYLASSVETFKPREQMVSELEEAGFANVQATPLTFGVAVIYVGEVASG